MTLNKLYDMTLRKLGVLAAGETAETDDVTVVTEAFNIVAAELDISSTGVTAGTGMLLANILASDLADDFQLDETRLQRFKMLRPQSVLAVRKIINDEYDTDTVITSEAF